MTTIDLPEALRGPISVKTTGLTLCLTSGVGQGPNPLAAFDAALFGAGIANFNLLRLSSVIPTGSTVLKQRVDLSNSGWGDRLYVVMSEQYETKPHAEAWAGIGWVQNADDNRGLFVEHHGSSEDEVSGLINDSLTSMTQYRNDDFGPIQMETAGAVCTDQPICSLVAVVYGSEPWETTGVVNDFIDIR